MRFLFSFSTLTILFAAAPVRAVSEYGQSKVAGAAGLTKYSGNASDIAGNVIGTALSFIGVLFFVLMVYAGFMWMTARGNEDQVNKSKSTLTAAMIGLIIVLASYAVTQFIFSSSLVTQ